MGVNFSNRLRSIRVLARYTSTEMASVFGVSKRTYDYYEAGKNLESEEKVRNLTAILDKFEKEKLHTSMQGEVGKSEDSDILKLQIEDLKQEITFIKQDLAFIKGLLQPSVALTTKKEKQT